MGKEQYKELADKVVPHMEAILEAFKEYAIGSAILYVGSRDGYFDISFSKDDAHVDIRWTDNGKDVELEVREKL